MSSQRIVSDALATLHQACFLGLQLMVAREQGDDVSGEWMFRLFRGQHEQFFLQSFEKLGLTGLPHAVACARYHVLSNSIGGVPVEYAEESPTKAWVRFRYPRWMFAGPTICGIPVESGRGFMRGWYAQNGVTLNNPRLGFVCVSEDATGEFGFCGYFREFEQDLSDDERLQFARDEMPPPFDANAQPELPSAEWSEARLANANRNFAVTFVRNSLTALIDVIGRDAAVDIGCRAARLIGLTYFQEIATQIGAVDGSCEDAADFLTMLFEGMGDSVSRRTMANGLVALVQEGLSIRRGVPAGTGDDVVQCWCELWVGALRSQQRVKEVTVERGDHSITWTISNRL